ncbi:endonuclease [Persephonella sp.]
MNKIYRIYRELLDSFGYQNWWPVHRDTDRFLEVSVGAILTQNTNWSNVEKAIENLLKENALNWETLLNIDIQELKHLIKPAGFYNQKAVYIKNFVKNTYKKPKRALTREFLLSIKGIGEETADSILLYGLDRLHFVVDAYTRRIFHRAGIIDSEKTSYRKLQNLIEESIPRDLTVYKEYHALIVELAKRHCRKKPVCDGCPIRNLCNAA